MEKSDEKINAEPYNVADEEQVTDFDQSVKLKQLGLPQGNIPCYKIDEKGEVGLCVHMFIFTPQLGPNIYSAFSAKDLLRLYPELKDVPKISQNYARDLADALIKMLEDRCKKDR